MTDARDSRFATRFGVVSILLASTALFAALPVLGENESNPLFQRARCPDYTPYSWRDTVAAADLAEIAQRIWREADEALRTVDSAVTRHYGLFEGMAPGFYVSAKETAREAVRFDPANQKYVLLFAQLHFRTAELGEGGVDLTTARGSLADAECAIELAETAGDVSTERYARRLLDQIRLAIQANEPYDF